MKKSTATKEKSTFYLVDNQQSIQEIYLETKQPHGTLKPNFDIPMRAFMDKSTSSDVLESEIQLHAYIRKAQGGDNGLYLLLRHYASRQVKRVSRQNYQLWVC